MSDSETELNLAEKSNRCSNFTETETHILLDLIEKNQDVLLSLMTTGTMNRQKEITWMKLTKEYNSLNTEKRDVENLKNKWSNLRRFFKKEVVKAPCHRDPIGNRIVSLLLNNRPQVKSKNSKAVNIDLDILKETEYKEDSCDMDTSNAEYIDDLSRKNVDMFDSNRSQNFTSAECSLLMTCVKKEKRYILNKMTNLKAVEMKNQAWERVTKDFNSNNFQSRTTKVLRTKFDNMKKRARRIYQQGNVNLDVQPIKSESCSSPANEEFNLMHNNDSRDDSFTIEVNPIGMDYINITSTSDSKCFDEKQNQSTNGNNVELEEFYRMKNKLIRCKLETAKLQRISIEETIDADRKYRCDREKLLALQLREAQLNVAIAEQKAHQLGITID